MLQNLGLPFLPSPPIVNVYYPYNVDYFITNTLPCINLKCNYGAEMAHYSAKEYGWLFLLLHCFIVYHSWNNNSNLQNIKYSAVFIIHLKSIKI